ncbi:LPD38 domain-containing protein [Delftia sp.]|uniref:LPD38 domain-containing protein n=1 Tax=Delftia sp. TaxID=1886637 RepID=UPI00259C7A7C|nr:LPD38 domain-containing protein [Delftia sp.]
MKVAQESGLIDPAALEIMKDQPYVPFYRLMEEDGGMRGPRFSSGLVNQQAWKKLKGGTQQLNADLLQNTLMNWSHLYAAAARNRASLETMDAAEKLGVAYQVPADTKGAVKVMREGVAEHWAVEDPYLVDAISAMSYTPPGIVKAMAPFKRLLTFGVTVNPTFKIRNLIRDSLSAIAQSDLSYNPLENVAKGWKATDKNSQTYASMLASGGIIKFGTQENTNQLRGKIERLGGTMLDKQGFDKLKGQMRSLWEVYEEFGDRTENVNRTALYERLRAKGLSHAEASFQARDLMDFSMSGKWETVRFLAQTVPFLNARLQALYKLGRAAGEDPRRFAAMAGAVSLASLGLLAAYADDDDWKKREDFDRDNFWWFKIGDKAFRIPKPFEVGAIGTVAERTAELMMSEEMTGKRFGQRISDMVFNTFAMDPTPQAIKPFLDVYANKDSFSGRAIEGMADERLRPQDRYNERTSEVARLLGSWGLPDPVRLAKGEYSGLSPKQVDFLLRGYFGWLATVSTSATDAIARPMLDLGRAPGHAPARHLRCWQLRRGAAHRLQPLRHHHVRAGQGCGAGLGQLPGRDQVWRRRAGAQHPGRGGAEAAQPHGHQRRQAADGRAGPAREEDRRGSLAVGGGQARAPERDRAAPQRHCRARGRAHELSVPWRRNCQMKPTAPSPMMISQ